MRYEADRPTEIIWAFSIWSEDRWTCIGGTVDPVARRLAAGRGVLRFTVPHFPLLAGRYILRATILDASTMYPLAVESSRSRECHIDVSTDPDPVTNMLIWANQLVRLDSEWDEPQEAGKEESSEMQHEFNEGATREAGLSGDAHAASL